MESIIGKEAALFFYTFMGAFVLYILNRHQGMRPFSLFSALNINVSTKANALVILLDMVFSSIIGSIVVLALVEPTTVAQAVVAGLGMTGILSVNSKQNTPQLGSQPQGAGAPESAGDKQ
ncbi:hypothetical protein MW332_004788 [Vibrio parahaemolyticus]|nr:hypothetical protein [Vibrio parahaemolyticus]ELB1485137.1 hypothetical protein [Vibrio parahaemolyticus]